MRKPRAVAFATAGVAVGIAAVLVSLMVSSGSPVFWEHYGCVRGTLLASQYNWTPDLFWNAPYAGAVFAEVRSTDGGAGGWGYNGSVSVDFGQFEWNLSLVNRVLESGPGPNQDCPTYEVSRAPIPAPWQVSGGGGEYLLGPGNTSDIGVPTQFNFSISGSAGLTSVIYHDAFVSANDRSVSTCGRGETEINLTSPGIDFQIPFRTASGRVLVDSTAYDVGLTSLPGFAMNFTYFFPAAFGTWQIDNLTMGPNAPGSGLAFSYSPCPA